MNQNGLSVSSFLCSRVEDLEVFLERNPHWIDSIFEEVGLSPLGLAASDGNVELVSWLIKNGADIERCDRDLGGETPFKIAFDCGHEEIFLILAEAGADPNLPGWMGISVSDRMKMNPGHKMIKVWKHAKGKAKESVREK